MIVVVRVSMAVTVAMVAMAVRAVPAVTVRTVSMPAVPVPAGPGAGSRRGASTRFLVGAGALRSGGHRALLGAAGRLGSGVGTGPHAAILPPLVGSDESPARPTA
ncbi:MAG: hypothetical protein DIU78_023060 [Pseudomonadota bacterium]